MYVYVQLNSIDLVGKVFYAPRAIKNVILIRFNKAINKNDKDLLLFYENKNWQGLSREEVFTNRELLLQLLDQLTNVIKQVQVE